MSKIVIKRNGDKVDFDKNKISTALFKVHRSVYSTREDEQNTKESNVIANMIFDQINSLDKEEIHVEEIQDIVEQVLMESVPNLAKAYILYRHKRTELRQYKAGLGIREDDLKLPLNSLIVLAARYLLKDQDGKIIETPKELFIRVANFISSVEKNYGKNPEEVEIIRNEFYDIMVDNKFMPNSPTLMNSATALGQLSGCFVIPIGDSIPEIFDAVKYAAMVHQSGGGTGFSFSRLRPANDVVRSTGGVASGPASFIKVFDAATEQIKQGGKRRGANMGILKVDHPDILDFIVIKENEGSLKNFNISVGLTEEFMRAVKTNRNYDLINPHTLKPVRVLNARAIWNLIVTMAWKTGDPGLIFLDRINSSTANPVPALGPIECSNPCGEQPLYPYDSCNLGSLNLSLMVMHTDHHFEMDWGELKRCTRIAVRFLDNVIDANNYPLQQIKDTTRAIRRIGLGVMGWADLLIKLKIKYDSKEALLLAERVMEFITNNARKTSEDLAEEKGPFPEFNRSIWFKLGYKPLRNSTVTTIAPTGTISIIAGGSSQGIEPIFSVVYMRNIQESLGSNLIEVNNEFEKCAFENGFYSEELMRRLAGKISIQDENEIPLEIKKLFVTAHDIDAEWHVKMQAAFQKHTDNAVSKTINLPNYATPQDIEKAYMLAYDLGCMGITVYRDQSKSLQVLQPLERKQLGLNEVKKEHSTDENSSIITMNALVMGATDYIITPKYETRCPECSTLMIVGGGCFTCPKCGFSKCGD